MGGICVAHKGIGGGGLKERKCLEKLDIVGSITLKMILNRLRGRGLDISDLR
jgi:hypothetical protein